MKKGKLQNAMKQFASAILQPALILSLIGVILIFGVLLSMDFMPEPLRVIGDFITTVFLEGGFQQLPLIFCVGVTCALTKKKKGEAATVAIVSFLIFVYSNHYWLEFNDMLIEPLEETGLIGTGQGIVLGMQVVDMGVFLGVILACINAFFLNRFSKVEFKGALALYSGTTFACLMDAIFVFLFGVAMCYVWPLCNQGILALGGFMSTHGVLGLFIYNFLQRFLISTGLHHLIYMPFYYTSLGGTLVLDGATYAGADVIWYAEIANLDKITAIHDSVRYMTCGFAQICGYIGATLAFLKTAEPEKRKAVWTLMLPAAILVLAEGITEPFEFTFMFSAPLLWFVHSVLDGLSQVLIYVLGSRIPMPGGLIDFIWDVMLVPANMSRWYILVACAIPVIVIWYLVFVFFIKKFNLVTPGRPGYELAGDGANIKDTLGMEQEEESESVLTGEEDDIIAGLGGKDNITELTNCATRLRVVVKDPSLVDETLINKVKNSGIIRKENNVQIIIGVTVGNLRNRIAERLGLEE